MRIDLHQHLWPPPLIAALRRRSEPPCIDDGGVLRLRHEPDGPIDLSGHDPARRIEALDAAGIERCLPMLSTPIGIEALPADEARPLLEAYHEGMADVMGASGGRIGAWAAAALQAPDCGAGDVRDLFDGGFCGLSLASEMLATPAALDRCRPLLDMLEESGRPLFVHPGPAPWTPPYALERGVPRWWTNLAVYPGMLNRAFWTWRGVGAPRHPRLRIVFPFAGGGAPLLEGRFRTFSGEAGELDTNVFVDTASCQRLALEHLMATYGVEQIVLGTDIPVIGPEPLVAALAELGDPVVRAVAERNPARLFDMEEAA